MRKIGECSSVLRACVLRSSMILNEGMALSCVGRTRTSLLAHARAVQLSARGQVQGPRRTSRKGLRTRMPQCRMLMALRMRTRERAWRARRPRLQLQLSLQVRLGLPLVCPKRARLFLLYLRLERARCVVCFAHGSPVADGCSSLRISYIIHATLLLPRRPPPRLLTLCQPSGTGSRVRKSA